MAVSGRSVRRDGASTDWHGVVAVAAQEGWRRGSGSGRPGLRAGDLWASGGVRWEEEQRLHGRRVPRAVGRLVGDEGDDMGEGDLHKRQRAVGMGDPLGGGLRWPIGDAWAVQWRRRHGGDLSPEKKKMEGGWWCRRGALAGFWEEVGTVGGRSWGRPMARRYGWWTWAADFFAGVEGDGGGGVWSLVGEDGGREGGLFGGEEW